jgi:hypothetical protein
MAKSKRRLAAIMNAVVVGFSRLMAADEEAAVAALNECRAVKPLPAPALKAGWHAPRNARRYS